MKNKQPNPLECCNCGRLIVTKHGRLKASKRGYGWCSNKCMTGTKKLHASCESESRIWRNVDRRGEDECWPCKYKQNNSGHCRINIGQKYTQVHRFVYEITRGPIPAGMIVCHSCDVPHCCNPKHLWLGTIKDNVHDMLQKGRNRSNPRTGESHPKSKLSNAIIKQIRESTESHFALSSRYGVKPQTIKDIWKGRTWKHVR